MEQDESLSASPRPLRKTISIKLKSNKSPSSSRRKTRSTKASKKDENEPSQTETDVVETPIFKTMEPVEPVHQSKRLCWDHKVNLIGEKVVDPMIHCCEKCSLPILIYGRMIQCKHVFCFTCAKETDKTCPRCKEPVQRIEQSALGTVFLCTYGGSKHSNDGCRRTYLSQRDLNAHIQHRHLKAEGRSQEQSSSKAPASAQPHRQSVPPPQPKTPQTVSPASAQALLEQFTAAVRQAHAAQAAQAASAAASAARTSQEEAYQRSQEMSHMSQPAPVSSAPVGLPHQMMHQTPPQSHSLPYPQTSMTNMPPAQQASVAPSQKPGLPPPQSTPLDNYSSNIPVMASGRTNLITVPIQDNDFGRKQEQQPQQPQQAGFPVHPTSVGMPPMNFPPPMGQAPPRYPPASMPPNIHQPPPGIPPPFSSQSVPGAPMPNPVYSASRPPPTHSIPGGPPLGPGPGPGPGPRQGPPPSMSMPPPGGPARFPPGQPGQRGPWPGVPPTRGPPAPGAPRGPPGPGGLPPARAPGPITHPPPPRPLPRADYNYY